MNEKTVIHIEKANGKLTANSREVYRDAWEALPDGWYRAIFEAQKRGYTPTRYKYYFAHVLEVILLTCGKMFSVWDENREKFVPVSNVHQIHDWLKMKYNPDVMISPLGTWVMPKSTTTKSDSEFINEFEEIIIAEFSAPPFGCDYMDRESWAEMMKAKKQTLSA